jgi:ribosome-binding factor A
MRLHHTERLTESVTRLSAEFLARHPASQGLVTVTGTRLDQSGRSATIFITVYPATDEAPALAETRVLRSGLRDFLDTRLRGNSLTHVDFALDARLKN